MAIISTGLGGDNDSDSSISQKFYVPKGTKKLSFNYNVISEEPMEYVGSAFDDKFQCTLEESYKSNLVSQESINSSKWNRVYGIDFYGGDSTTYMTGWKSIEYDVSKYQGKYITLKYHVWDAGDSAYDTAALIDDIRLDDKKSTLYMPVEIEDNHDILFVDQNVTWKYVGEDFQKLIKIIEQGTSAARSDEDLQRIYETEEYKNLNKALANRKLKLNAQQLAFTFLIDPSGVQDYLYCSKDESLVNKVYKVLTGKDPVYYEHVLFSGWQKTDTRTDSDSTIFSQVRSNADTFLVRGDGMPQDLIDIIEPTAAVGLIFTGLGEAASIVDAIALIGWRGGIELFTCDIIGTSEPIIGSASDEELSVDQEIIEDEVVNKLGDADTIRSIDRQNETADLLAEEGYDIKMLPNKVGGNGNGIDPTANPDYKIDGEVFDCYSPSTKNVRNIGDTIKGKTTSQARRIIINLDDFNGSMDDLAKQFYDWTIDSLDELLIVKDGKIARLFLK